MARGMQVCLLLLAAVRAHADHSWRTMFERSFLGDGPVSRDLERQLLDMRRQRDDIADDLASVARRLTGRVGSLESQLATARARLSDSLEPVHQDLARERLQVERVEGRLQECTGQRIELEQQAATLAAEAVAMRATIANRSATPPPEQPTAACSPVPPRCQDLANIHSALANETRARKRCGAQLWLAKRRVLARRAELQEHALEARKRARLERARQSRSEGSVPGWASLADRAALLCLSALCTFLVFQALRGQLRQWESRVAELQRELAAEVGETVQPSPLGQGTEGTFPFHVSDETVNGEGTRRLVRVQCPGVHHADVCIQVHFNGCTVTLDREACHGIPSACWVKRIGFRASEGIFEFKEDQVSLSHGILTLVFLRAEGQHHPRLFKFPRHFDLSDGDEDGMWQVPTDERGPGTGDVALAAAADVAYCCGGPLPVGCMAAIATGSTSCDVDDEADAEVPDECPSPVGGDFHDECDDDDDDDDDDECDGGETGSGCQQWAVEEGEAPEEEDALSGALSSVAFEDSWRIMEDDMADDM